MEFNLRGGVLIIGSLFWQDHRDKEGDDIRTKWRETHLKMELEVSIKVPIKYGRYSREGSYTMVFDNTLTEKNFGSAKAIPLSSSFEGFEDIKREVNVLSKTEGRHESDFIKGKRKETTAWCVCGVLFNPETINDELKSSILNKWSLELRRNKVGYDTFLRDPSLYSMSKEGELQVPWPKELNDFDFLLATSTKPIKRPGAEALTAEEIANYVENRPYFYPNIENGISTFQDDQIISYLTSPQPPTPQ